MPKDNKLCRSAAGWPLRPCFLNLVAAIGIAVVGCGTKPLLAARDELYERRGNEG